MTAGRNQPLRVRVLALAMSAPVLLAAAGVTVIEAWSILRPDSPWIVSPGGSSLAEAVSRGDTLTTYELLRAGRDPNQPISVRVTEAGADRQVSVAPLLWAVSQGKNDVVLILVAFGARLDPDARDYAVCFARANGSDLIAHVLSQDRGSRADVVCPTAIDATILLDASRKPTRGP